MRTKNHRMIIGSLVEEVRLFITINGNIHKVYSHSIPHNEHFIQITALKWHIITALEKRLIVIYGWKYGLNILDWHIQNYNRHVQLFISRPSNVEDLEKVTFDESEFGIPEEAEVEDEEDMTEDIPGIMRILSSAEQDRLTDDSVHLVYQQPLLNLARLRINASCNIQGCSQIVELKHESIGSAFYIKWVSMCVFACALPKWAI